MAIPFGRFAFTSGEVSPDLFGRADMTLFPVACATARNFYVGYTGGLYSRAGTMFVGYSKQTGRLYPPRLLPFQFNIQQGLTIEVGHEYMRFIENGAYVTETPLAIVDITNADPGVVEMASVDGATAATPNNAAVTGSYAPGDKITLTGGTFISPAVLNVTNTSLKALSVLVAGSGYEPADTLALTGGVQTTPVELTVVTTKVSAIPTIVNAGTTGTPGPATVTGTTGTGTLFQATVTIDGAGLIASVDSLSVAGSYSVNPTVPTAEPVTGGGLTGAELGILLGIEAFTITDAGVFTTNASGGTFTQASTSGTGTGATFQAALFQPEDLTVHQAGNYSVTPSNPVAQASTTGTGVGATYTVTFAAVLPFSDGDWVFLADVGGMTEVNGQTYVVNNATTTTFELTDVFGNDISTVPFGTYTSGGTAARIYTLDTPYQEEDLRYLKWAQSEDVVSLCLVNQTTLVEYAPRDLSRFANNNWTIEEITTEPTVDAPTNLGFTSSGSGSCAYAYQVTATDPDNGTESLPSLPYGQGSNVDIAATAGSNTLSWDPVEGVTSYNLYKATPTFGGLVPAGALYGFAGIAYGTQFIDTNIIADFSQVPPQARNPFVRGAILGATPVLFGSGYTNVTFTINTSTGSGAVLVGLLAAGTLRSIQVFTPGKNYGPTDTVTITGDGSGATATLTIGPQEGTYPSVVSYFQQRRVYANTINKPDTYFMSQPGSFLNFDVRIPTIDSDAITGSPWSVQVNGIQQMIPLPGGLMAMTGNGSWQLTGSGGSSFNPQPITPASQGAQQQAFNGCNDKLPLIQATDDVLFVQNKLSVVRNLGYQYSQNIFTGADLTLMSNHLFLGFQITDWTWCEEPYKTAWVVRDDGILMTLTYLKSQNVNGWTRHDTQGLYQSVCSVTELPVDALYLAVLRTTAQGTSYMIERMDNRIWRSVEDAWCVDAGLALPQPEPDAQIIASSARGLGAIASYTIVDGGSGYSAGTFATIEDEDTTSGASGATISLTITAGVITAATGGAGTHYVRPKVTIFDPAESDGGVDGEIVAVLDNSVTLTVDPAVFVSGDVGDVVRMGGGIIEITAFTNSSTVTGIVLSPIVELIANAPGVPQPQMSGDWTQTTPTDVVSGLGHLIGQTVTGLYDGKILPPTIVDANGQIELPEEATSVVVGLGYECQMQTVYLDPGMGPTGQGQRKTFPKVTVRVRQTRGLEMGTNQVDGSTLSPMELTPVWSEMVELPDLAVPPYGRTVEPLYTGDITETPKGDYSEHGQIALQQRNPLPAAILALVPAELPGDVPELEDPKPRNR